MAAELDATSAGGTTTPAWRDLKSPGHVLASGLIFALFLVFVLPDKAQQGALLHPGIDTPDLLLHYSRDKLYAIFEALGPTGRAAYVYDRWTFDVVWPLAYSYLYLALLGNLCRGLGLRTRAWLGVALAPLVLDLFENTCGALVARAYPEPRDVLATLAGYLTTAKWISVGLAAVVIVVGAVMYGLRPRRDAD